MDNAKYAANEDATHETNSGGADEQKKRKLDEIKSRTQRAAELPKNLANAIPAGDSQDTVTSLQSATNHFKKAAKNVISLPPPKPTNVSKDATKSVPTNLFTYQHDLSSPRPMTDSPPVVEFVNLGRLRIRPR